MDVNSSDPSAAVISHSDFEHELIVDIVREGSKVLDLGCGEGTLLHLLTKEKNIEGAGVEVAEEKVYQCINKGLSVHHGDIDEGLADYPDGSFHYVILSETLQEIRKPALVIKEMLRVGEKAIVSFPNFAYWQMRLQLLFSGRAPVTATLPFEWYEGPNIQFLSIKDFMLFCRKMDYTVFEAVYINHNKPIKWFPNLMADSVLLVLG